MRLLVALLVWFLRGVFASRGSLALENLDLRQQLATYARTQNRPRLNLSEAGPRAGSCSRLRHAAQRGGAEVRGRLRDLLARGIRQMYVRVRGLRCVERRRLQGGRGVHRAKAVHCAGREMREEAVARSVQKHLSLPQLRRRAFRSAGGATAQAAWIGTSERRASSRSGVFPIVLRMLV